MAYPNVGYIHKGLRDVVRLILCKFFAEGADVAVGSIVVVVRGKGPYQS